MKRVATLALAVALLGGCSGAQYMLPQLSDADISRAALTVQGDVSGLPKFNRSLNENRELLYKVSRRLEPASRALCEHAKVANCYFYVIFHDKDDVNAYANEKREVHVNRGLLDYLETEEEVAAVVAHEMGHHIAQHVEETQANAAIGAIIGAVLVGAALAATNYEGTPNQTQQILNDSAGVGAMFGQLSFSKEQEREADMLAAYILERSHYDLRKAGHTFTVLARMNREKTRSTMFDTHPAGPERIAAWEKAAAEVEASPDKFPKDGK